MYSPLSCMHCVTSLLIITKDQPSYPKKKKDTTSRPPCLFFFNPKPHHRPCHRAPQRLYILPLKYTGVQLLLLLFFPYLPLAVDIFPLKYTSVQLIYFIKTIIYIIIFTLNIKINNNIIILVIKPKSI
jgi:hypothetical protein